MSKELGDVKSLRKLHEEVRKVSVCCDRYIVREIIVEKIHRWPHHC
uniref:Uncharacterized protein n=1 Tax=Parascaris equorum TaxID=6256 RepID=A0A914RY43_PAREQ